MDTLREKSEIRGVGVTCYKQSGTSVLIKVLMTPSDAIDLCSRTKSGLFKNKEFHDRFINTIVTRVEALNAQEAEKVGLK